MLVHESVHYISFALYRRWYWVSLGTSSLRRSKDLHLVSSSKAEPEAELWRVGWSFELFNVGSCEGQLLKVDYVLAIWHLIPSLSWFFTPSVSSYWHRLLTCTRVTEGLSSSPKCLIWPRTDSHFDIFRN